jgi:hypothetical protein
VINRTSRDKGFRGNYDITHLMLNHIYDSYSYLLQRWDTPFLSQESLQSYAKGAPLKKCFGFVDGTVVQYTDQENIKKLFIMATKESTA